MNSGRKKSIILILVFNSILLAVLLSFILLVYNRSVLPPFMRKCVFLHILHIYCPGCGATRAVFCLFRGEIWRSLKFNPAVMLGGIIILYYEIRFITAAVTSNYKKYVTNFRHRVLIFYALFIIIFSVFRDIMLLNGIDLLGNIIK